MDNKRRDPGSFRDLCGFVFYRDEVLYRQINQSYQNDYDFLVGSGLYQKLVDAGLLVSHEEVGDALAFTSGVYKVIRPQKIPFVSYPFEWSFTQLKQAALLTLQIQKIALEYGMSLKDASAYNVQFFHGQPIFVDTLSFEKYQEGRPWVAYRQFCQHFLSPLALMCYRDVRLNQLLRIYMDGIPLALTQRLLPMRTWLNIHIVMHLHFHSRMQLSSSAKPVDRTRNSFTRLSLCGLLDSLETAIQRLYWDPSGTEWAGYYEVTNYTQDAISHKKELVASFLDRLNPRMVWDLGANTGFFSRVASDRGILTVSIDSDSAAVENNFREACRKNERNILPLTLDLINPSSGLGWASEERVSLVERGPADVAMALAIIHHLAISNNVPLFRIAEFFNKLCHFLIIEFIPKHDSQIKKFFSLREDIFQDYSVESFEKAFGQFFVTQDKQKIKDSVRILYLMRNKNNFNEKTNRVCEY